VALPDGERERIVALTPQGDRVHYAEAAGSETFACRVKGIAITFGVPAPLMKRSLLLRRKAHGLNLALTPVRKSGEAHQNGVAIARSVGFGLR
jgi:hypothetical protein